MDRALAYAAELQPGWVDEFDDGAAGKFHCPKHSPTKRLSGFLHCPKHNPTKRLSGFLLELAVMEAHQHCVHLRAVPSNAALQRSGSDLTWGDSKGT